MANNPSVKEMLIENLEGIRKRIDRAALVSGRNSSAIILIGASKTFSVERINILFQAGLTNFGENYVQGAKQKRVSLDEIGAHPRWHMIGHLQRNKVKEALTIFDVIQTVDSVRLAEEIARRSTKPIPIMLEVNIGEEPSKSGFNPMGVAQAYRTLKIFPELSIVGLMTIAPELENSEDTRPFFRRLRLLGQDLGLAELSMGMTNDFEVAIEEGSTMVRIGRALFGHRP